MAEWTPRNTRRCQSLRNGVTPAERALWIYLRARHAGGWKFCRQMEVRQGAIGPYYPDFLCREAKLVVELDGYTHDFMTASDARRTADLKALGYDVLRFSNEAALVDPEGVVTSIVRFLADRPTPDPSRKREGSA